MHVRFDTGPRTYDADHGLRTTQGRQRSQRGRPAEGEAAVRPGDLAQAQPLEHAPDQKGSGGCV
jgi:hypothetical protein